MIREGWYDGTQSIVEPYFISDNFLTAIDMLQTLKSYNGVDVICYTFNCNMMFDSIKIKRVIASKMFGIPEKIKYKLAAHLHVKMFLCYSDTEKVADVFMGSWNFNAPTYTELMYRLPEKEHKFCIEYFEDLWGQLS